MSLKNSQYGVNVDKEFEDFERSLNAESAEIKHSVQISMNSTLSRKKFRELILKVPGSGKAIEMVNHLRARRNPLLTVTGTQGNFNNIFECAQQIDVILDKQGETNPNGTVSRI